MPDFIDRARVGIICVVALVPAVAYSFAMPLSHRGTHYAKHHLAHLTPDAVTTASGSAPARLSALLAKNRALSPENAPPTIVQTVVSLNDQDVVASAQAASQKAGHNGLHYDYALFKAAIAKVQRLKAGALDIPTRTYRIYESADMPNLHGIIDLTHLSNVVIDGHGATLLFYTYGKAVAPLVSIHPRAAILINQSDHIVLRNLVIDWGEPLAVPITVHGSGAPGSPQTFTVDPAFPIDPGAPIPFTVLSPFDVARRTWGASRDMTAAELSAWKASMAPGGSTPYTCPAPASGVPQSTCFRYVGGQSYAFGPAEHLYPVSPNPGNYLALARDSNFGAVIVDGGSSNLTFDNLTIYNSPGQALALVTAGQAVRISNIHVVRKPDSQLTPGEQPRFISTLADAMDVIASQGDVVIENSEFAFQGDDGLNVLSAPRVGQATGADTLQAKTATINGYYHAGELVDIYDNAARTVIASKVPIASATWQPGQPTATITLAPGTVQLQPGNRYQLRARDWDSARVIIRNNWYHDNRARGVIVHGDDIAIAGNKFERTTAGAIQVLYDNKSGNPEGSAANNIVISGNTIEDVNTNWYNPAFNTIAVPAAISIYATSRSAFSGLRGLGASDLIAQHLVVNDNVIKNVPGVGILISEANDVELKNNHVQGAGSHNYMIPALDGKSIVVERSTGVVAGGNIADGPIVINAE